MDRTVQNQLERVQNEALLGLYYLEYTRKLTINRMADTIRLKELTIQCSELLDGVNFDMNTTYDTQNINYLGAEVCTRKPTLQSYNTSISDEVHKLQFFQVKTRIAVVDGRKLERK